MVGLEVTVIKVRALCVKEPWATLQVRGIKGAEIRNGRTNHRGDLLIVASLQPDMDAVRIHTAASGSIPITNLGMAIGFVRVVDCVPFTPDLVGLAMIKCPVQGTPWAWLLDKTQARFIEPFPVKGRLGIFDVKYCAISEVQ